MRVCERSSAGSVQQRHRRSARLSTARLPHRSSVRCARTSTQGSTCWHFKLRAKTGVQRTDAKVRVAASLLLRHDSITALPESGAGTPRVRPRLAPARSPPAGARRILPCTSPSGTRSPGRCGARCGGPNTRQRRFKSGAGFRTYFSGRTLRIRLY